MAATKLQVFARRTGSKLQRAALAVCSVVLLAPCSPYAQSAADGETLLRAVQEIARTESFRDLEAMSRILGLEFEAKTLKLAVLPSIVWFVPRDANASVSSLRITTDSAPGADITFANCIRLALAEKVFAMSPDPYDQIVTVHHIGANGEQLLEPKPVHGGFSFYTFGSSGKVVGVNMQAPDRDGCAHAVGVRYNYGPGADDFRRRSLQAK